MSSIGPFAQGFFLGQLSVVLLIGAFIKFFIFGEAPSQSKRTVRAPKHIRKGSLSFISKSPPQSARKQTSVSSVLRPVPTNATDIASILRKTYYQISLKHNGRTDHRTHQPESLDWFNVLLAQTIAQYRQTAYNLRDLSPDRPSILTSLSKALNDPTKKPSFVDTIKVTEISMGEEFPIFSNVRVVTIEDDTSPSGGRLQALMDLDLSDDNLTLGIETNLLLNYPKPASAVLPIALSVSVVRFSATLSISFVPALYDPPQPGQPAPPPSSKPKTDLAFSFLPDYRLDLSVRSLLGSRSRLQDLPKVAQLIEARMHAWFEERVVEPRVQVVPLPGLWPRMGKTRVREGQEDDKPVSQDNTPRSVAGVRNERRSDNFPSQAEAEALIHGLRLRSAGSQRRNSDVFLDDNEDDRRRMPGSLPT